MKNDLLKIVIGARRTQVIVYTDVPVNEEEDSGFYDKAEDFEPDDSLYNVFAMAEINNDIIASEKGISKYNKLNYKRRKRYRINAVRELVYNNFDANRCCMLTLTFEKNVTNLDIAHREFKKFIQRIHYKFNGFAYVGTFAKQNRGAWHYHLICNLSSDADPEMISKIWKNGAVYVSKIEGGSDLREKVNYCVKNMNEMSEDHLKAEKGYLCSKGLQRNIVLCSWKENEVEKCLKYFEEIRAMNSKLIFEKPLQYEESGDIHYVECCKKFPELFQQLPLATLRCEDEIN